MKSIQNKVDITKQMIMQLHNELLEEGIFKKGFITNMRYYNEYLHSYLDVYFTENYMGDTLDD